MSRKRKLKQMQMLRKAGMLTKVEPWQQSVRERERTA